MGVNLDFVSVSASPALIKKGEVILERRGAAGHWGELREEGLKEGGDMLHRVRRSKFVECLLGGGQNSLYENMKIEEAE